MAELLRPQYKDISAIYAGEFGKSVTQSSGAIEMSWWQLESAWWGLCHVGLTDDEREFLISFKNRRA